jgi:alpha-glucosidase (family GH31 glycosyl hydrolase)
MTIFFFCLLLFNTVRYPPGQMRAFVDRMATNGQHWMCLVNPGIAVAKGFRAFEEGTREGIFIKDYQGNDYVGQVSGPTTS